MLLQSTADITFDGIFHIGYLPCLQSALIATDDGMQSARAPKLLGHCVRDYII